MHLTIGASKSNRQLWGLIIGLGVLGLIWELASWIIAGEDQTLIMFGLGVVVCCLVVYILNDWRSGVLLFLIWLLFEDLARKYLGNSMVIYFAKDLLIAVGYLSFYVAKRKGQVATFKVPFLLPLTAFFLLAVIQVFNPWTPSVLYGILGLKMYFYYVPLMYLGYAMMDTPQALERFFLVNVAVGLVIAGLGIAQSILGVQFLTPENGAAALYELSHVTRVSPITHQSVSVTSSVFVSAGRFGGYIILLWILLMGAQGYLLLSRKPRANYGFLALGVVTVSVLVTGTRTPFVFVSASALMMTAAFLWGAPWRWGQGHRMVKALRRAFVGGAIGLILMGTVFPTILGKNWAFISETLDPGGEGNELENRGVAYPILNLVYAFQHDRWIEGYGTGLNSLGMQYIGQLINEPVPNIGVESGYGALIVEFGILGLVLWIVWVSALLWSGWRVVNQLRQTVYFPIAFAIWWYALVLLVLLVYFGLPSYQNFPNNAYLWLLVGVLYRLPDLAKMPQPVPMTKEAKRAMRWQPVSGLEQSSSSSIIN